MPDIGCYGIFAFIAFSGTSYIYVCALVGMAIAEPLDFTGLRTDVLQTELIAEHCNELPIGGLVLLGGDAAAEGLVQRVDAAAAPCDLDGMADRPFNLTGRGVEALANARVEFLGEGKALGILTVYRDMLNATNSAFLTELKQIAAKYSDYYIQELILKISANESSGGCYVATCVYGSYDCPQVWTLRRYRDYTLVKTWYGRSFIRTYYTIILPRPAM